MAIFVVYVSITSVHQNFINSSLIFFNLLNTCLLLGKIMRTDFILQFTDNRIILVNLLQFITILVVNKVIFVNFWLNRLISLSLER